MDGHTLKYLLLIPLTLFIFGCGGGGGEVGVYEDETAERVVIIGDSMALGIAVDYSCDPAEVYQNFSWEDYIFEHEVVNEGISGAGVQEVLDNAQPEDGNIVVLWAGFNNIKLDENIADIAFTYSRIYEYYKSYGCEVYCVGVPPINKAIASLWWEPAVDFDNNRVVEFNLYMEDTCGDYYIDTYNVSADINGESAPEYTADGVHPSVLMYEYVLSRLQLE